MAYSNIAAPVPAHVPPERVHDFDIFDPPGMEDDYHLAYKRLQDAGLPDIFWTPRNGGHWLPTRGELIAEIFKDYERFSSRVKAVPKEQYEGTVLKPINLDPPEHGKFRALIQPFFSMSAIRPLEDEVRALSIGLIEGFRRRGHCDFVSDFAQHLPIGIFMNMVKLPESDRLPLLALVEQVINPGERPKLEIFAELGRYVAAKVIERRAQPGDDLISRVVNSNIDGQPISIEDAVAVCNLVLIGGLDTVASTLGFVAHFLARRPEHRRRLRENPALVQGAVDEFLRRFAVTNPGRVVAHDLDYRGVAMRAGDMVILPSFLHGLDDRVHDDPASVRFDRPLKPNSAFGNGDHRCPGSNLARVELKVFLQEWLPRIPDFSIPPGEKVGVRAGINGSFYRLPLVWSAQAATM